VERGQEKKRSQCFLFLFVVVNVDTSHEKKRKQKMRGRLEQRAQSTLQMPARVVDRVDVVDGSSINSEPLPSLQTGSLVGHEGVVLCVEFNATGAYALTGGKVSFFLFD